MPSDHSTPQPLFTASDPLGLKTLNVLDAGAAPPPRVPWAAKITAILLAVLAIGIRLPMLAWGPLKHPQTPVKTLSARYLDLASNLNTYGALVHSESVTDPLLQSVENLRRARHELEPVLSNSLQPEISLMPGYPVFLGAFQFFDAGRRGPLIAQCFLSGLTAWFLFGIAWRLLGSTAGAMLATLIVAVHPADILASQTLLPQTLFTFVMTMGLYIIIRSRRSPAGAGLGGLLLGGSALILPMGILMGPFAATWILLTERSRVGAGAATVLLIGSAVGPGLWMARNHRIGFGWQISSEPIVQSLFDAGAAMDDSRNSLSDSDTPQNHRKKHLKTRNNKNKKKSPTPHPHQHSQAVRRILKQLRQDQSSDDLFTIMARQSFQRLREHPKRYLRLLASNSARFFTDHSTHQLMAHMGVNAPPVKKGDRLLTKGNMNPLKQIPKKPGTALAIAWMSWNLLLIGMMDVGMVFLILRSHWRTLFLAGGLIVYVILATQLHATETSRIPVIGMQAILCAGIFGTRKHPKATASLEQLLGLPGHP